MHDAEGVPRVPSTVIEALFHLACTATAWRLERRGVLRGQLFHAYLIAYGLFRFVTEFWRDTPRFGFGLSPYQLLAVALAAFAAWRFRVRALAPRASS
jgi:phosphatidylglycerol:prolipoprotein diacylglycerol transferase